MIKSRGNCTLKTAIFMLAAIFALGLTSSTEADTLTAGVPANFGIEGDIYADTTQFGGLGVGTNTDDWFDKYPMLNGIGVIDTNGGGAYYQLIQAGGNATNKLFKRGMAFPVNTVQHGKLLFDAVYVRDFNSSGGLLDSSQFVGTSDKNADNPHTWSIGASSVPHKDDIVDAFAHLRDMMEQRIQMTSGSFWDYPEGSCRVTAITTGSFSGQLTLYLQAAPFGPIPDRTVAIPRGRLWVATCKPVT